MKSSILRQAPQALFSSAQRAWNAFEADFVRIPPGRAEATPAEQHTIGIHFGPPVIANCRVGDALMKGVQRSGDISVIPAGMSGFWEDDGACHILRLRLRPSFLEEVAKQLEKDPAKLEILPCFELRDARIESIGRAMKADLEASTPSDPLFIDSLVNALAVRLIELAAGKITGNDTLRAAQIPMKKLKTLMDFIETNLGERLLLSDLASVAEVSTTSLKTLFRNSTGTSVHQYVISRRVEYARALLSTTVMSLSEIALVAGFAHQSHMTTTMRRVLGQSPSDIVRHKRGSGRICKP